MFTAYALVFWSETIEKYGGFDKVPDHVFMQEDPLAFGLIGILATALGGYVAGRIARGRQVLHGVVVAVTSLLLGFALQLALDGRVLLYGWDILFVVLMIPAGALGGYVAYCLRKAVRPPAPGVPTTPIS
jgi:putative membrane protein (TIGR04086 family)